MSKIKLDLKKPAISKGFLHIDSSLPIPELDYSINSNFVMPVTIECGFVLGHYVGTTFRVISCHKFLDDARFARKRDLELYNGRDYRILYVSSSIYPIV